MKEKTSTATYDFELLNRLHINFTPMKWYERLWQILRLIFKGKATFKLGSQ